MTSETLPPGVAEFLEKSGSSGSSRIKRRLIRHFVTLGKPFICCYCGVKVHMVKTDSSNVLPDDYLTVEHLKTISVFRKDTGIPLKPKQIRQKSGSPINKSSNLEISCYRCNNKKSAPPKKFYPE